MQAPDGRVEVVKEVGGGPNGLALGPGGALFVANNGGRFTFAEQGGLLVPGHPRPDYAGGSIQRLDLRTGEPLGLPATEPVAVYPCQVVGTDVLVDVKSPLSPINR